MTQQEKFLNAAKQGDGPMVAELLRQEPELITAADEYDKTALHWGAEKDHAEVARMLLDAAADIEAKTTWGDTAAIDTRGFFGGRGLHWAAINGHRETVELLIERGANLDIRDEQFASTPEGWATEGGHIELVHLLHPSR